MLNLICGFIFVNTEDISWLNNILIIGSMGSVLIGFILLAVALFIRRKKKWWYYLLIAGILAILANLSFPIMWLLNSI